MERTDFFVERTDCFMEPSNHGTKSVIDFTVLYLADYRLVSQPFFPALAERCVTSKKRLRGRLTTDEQIKISVTENTESGTFCMEEYSEKYTIVV